MSRLRLLVLRGAALEGALDALAALRIAVFRDWPYLYDGDLDYGRGYLEVYRTSPDAVVVGAFDGNRLVGAATGTPMADHADAFAAPLAVAGLAPDAVFYCAESVLLPAYRGQGAGHAFFDAREAHARALGHTHSAFCAVVRPADHPLRPPGYRPLDPFWHRRGYRPIEGATARFSWKDIDRPEPDEKPLQLWLRRLDGAVADTV